MELIGYLMDGKIFWTVKPTTSIFGLFFPQISLTCNEDMGKEWQLLIKIYM